MGRISPNPTGIDAYAPAEMAARVEEAGVGKARLPALPTLVLAMLAGAFIAFGAMFYTLVMIGNDLGFGPSRILGGIAFSVGLVLVIVGGAELFTGNALIVMAWASRRISLAALLRNWLLVYVGNLAGALGAAALVYLSGTLALDGGEVARTASMIAEAKLSLPADQAFFRGVLCNALVCLAVWLCFSARDVTGKILAIIWPISACRARLRALGGQYVPDPGRHAGRGRLRSCRLRTKSAVGDAWQHHRRRRRGGAGLLGDLSASARAKGPRGLNRRCA
jgi:formate transporter